MKCPHCGHDWELCGIDDWTARLARMMRQSTPAERRTMDEQQRQWRDWDARLLDEQIRPPAPLDLRWVARVMRPIFDYACTEQVSEKPGKPSRLSRLKAWLRQP